MEKTRREYEWVAEHESKHPYVKLYNDVIEDKEGADSTKILTGGLKHTCLETTDIENRLLCLEGVSTTTAGKMLFAGSNPSDNTFFGKALINATYGGTGDRRKKLGPYVSKMEDRTMTEQEYKKLLAMPCIYERLKDGDKRADSVKEFGESFHQTRKLPYGKCQHLVSYQDGIQMLKERGDAKVKLNLSWDPKKEGELELTASQAAEKLEDLTEQYHCEYIRKDKRLSFMRGEGILFESYVDFLKEGPVSKLKRFGYGLINKGGKTKWKKIHYKQN